MPCACTHCVAPDAFHFGGRHWSEDENVGYFWEQDRLVALRKNGRVTGVWPGLSALLAEELAASEELMRQWSDGRWQETTH